MMKRNPDLDAAIEAALTALATGAALPQAATRLFAALGYRSTRVLAGQNGRVEDFIAEFPAPVAGTVSEKELRDHATAVHLLFQVTDEEIHEESSGSSQGTLLNTNNFDEGLNKSYLFLAVELNGERTSRSQYAEFTREINKRFPMPAFLLFRAKGGLVTLAFVQRRRHKRDQQRRVLGSVSLIRDIDPNNPHRAHREILTELSLSHRLEWMGKHGKPSNFDGLLAALLASLDTQELNKRFYKDLFGWFERAKEEARFPTNQARRRQPEWHVIRLITRMLFVWFIKEKGLVAEELFIEKQVRSLLKNYDLAQGDSYYRAVLQNLFFATLNTRIDKRGFSAKQQTTHRDFSRYRHQDEMADPDKLLALFQTTPLINGGLFDCLDSFDSTSTGGYRIDCFSDHPGHKNLLSIPDRLFFAADGLVSIFNRYKFTVEENTPIEQEVALDPELLGKVFENLLAAINPETRETARRQTGSYYTPRLMVDTMVEEALVATLAQKARPDDGDAAYWQERLRYLLDYEDAFNDAKELFEDGETKGIVEAIAQLKVLDPAVGSGAFPMGILHKLTLALQRLDPDNTRWQALQKERASARANAAFETKDQHERNAELLDISQTFERYSGDFGRKLYLIQNSIFGVDIQPVACQIAKLRFFISLAIEQQPNNDPSDNYGIKPLPNLETRFVAANTLLALDSTQGVLTSPRTQRLEQDLRQSRERYFHANTRDLKLRTRQQDRKLRDALASELRHIGMADSDAEKISRWDPYDQNAQADWFDAKYMFGNQDGFDVVIGNPPYVRQEKIGSHKLILVKQYADAVTKRSDLCCYFYARGLQLLRNYGLHVFICSNSWLDVGYGAKLQDYLLKYAHIQTIYESALERQFTTADINTVISIIQKCNSVSENDTTNFVSLRAEFETALGDAAKRREIKKSRAELRAAGSNSNKFHGDKWGGKYLRAPDIYHHILENHADKLVRLGDVATVRFGIKTGANNFFFLTSERIAEFGIEEKYCQPVMTTPQESRSVAVAPNTLPKCLFMCHDDQDSLDGTGALTYIEWGQEQNYHQRTSVRSRKRWYDLGERKNVYLAMNKLVDTTARTYLAVKGLLFSDNFQVMSIANNSSLMRLCAAMNSTLSQLMLNLESRSNFGEGVLEIQTYETQNLYILNSKLLPEPNITVFSTADWDVLEPSAARRHIDDAVFDVLGLSSGERDAVYEGVVELVENRKRRARSGQD